jgi:hypothetical protein
MKSLIPDIAIALAILVTDQMAQRAVKGLDRRRGGGESRPNHIPCYEKHKQTIGTRKETHLLTATIDKSHLIWHEQRGFAGKRSASYTQTLRQNKSTI